MRSLGDSLAPDEGGLERLKELTQKLEKKGRMLAGGQGGDRKLEEKNARIILQVSPLPEKEI